ncbi:hypothetical protein ACKWTF_010735 [Chironomus riparius]
MPKVKVKINVKERLEDNVLDLSLLEIEDIPVRDIAEVKRATVLDLSSNNIRFIPKNFGTHLSHIYRIDLSKNQLRFLPDDFGNLTNLKHLDLYNNQLEHLPITFGHLSKLKYLDLKANPLNPALQKIIGPCITGKDCQNAAKNVVPYYIDLEKKMIYEKRKKAEREEKERELEAERQREEKRLAKKAARKERKLLEKQQAEEENLISNDNEIKESLSDEPESNNKQNVSVKSVPSTSLNFVKLIIRIFLFFFIIIILGAISFKYLPTQFNAITSFLSDRQRKVFYNLFERIDESVQYFTNK